MNDNLYYVMMNQEVAYNVKAALKIMVLSVTVGLDQIKNVLLVHLKMKE